MTQNGGWIPSPSPLAIGRETTDGQIRKLTVLQKGWSLSMAKPGCSCSLLDFISCIPFSSIGTLHLHRLHSEEFRLPPASGVTWKKTHGSMGIGVFPRTETNGQTWTRLNRLLNPGICLAADQAGIFIIFPYFSFHLQHFSSRLTPALRE